MPETPAERTDISRLGLLTDGTRSDEQRAARAAAEVLGHVDTLDFESLTTTDDLDEFDLLWWHRDEPIEDETLSEDVAAIIAAYVHDGGGLFVSQYALTALDTFGIDPHTPDTVDAAQTNDDPRGLLVKQRFADLPPFETFEDLRIHTEPEGVSTPTIAYEDIVPRYGEVLASAVVDDADRPNQNTVVAWEHGDGQVLGVSQHLTFSAAETSVRDSVDTLLSGIVDYLAGDGDSLVTGRPKTATEMTAMRETVADHHRPQYHFSPPANWLNDPNGLVEWDGTYHMFYQYNPAGPYHGSIHWGHATSEDLLHWDDEPVALEPTLGTADEHGCWSGCTVDNDGTPTFVYTGGSGGDQLPCLAEATDETLVAWTKHPENPVIDDPQAELDILSNDRWNAEFRDHDVWREDGTWYHLIGAGIQDEGGTAVLYTGESLTDWELVGPVLVGDTEEDGVMWECPELLRFDELDLLQVSNYDKVVYYTGQFDGETFDRQGDGVTDYGSFYAAQTMADDQGRYLSWGWITEDRSEAAQWDAGWSGVMSLPRVMWVDEDQQVRIEPAEEVTGLRERGQSVSNVTLGPDDDQPLPDLSGDALELNVTFELEDAEAFELVVGEAPDGSERTPIRYTADGELILDRSESSQDDAASTDTQRIDEVPGDGPVHLQVFVDGSVIEVFVNGRTTLSSRIYPTSPDSTGVSCSVRGGRVSIDSFDCWELDSTMGRTQVTDSVTSPRTTQ